MPKKEESIDSIINGLQHLSTWEKDEELSSSSCSPLVTHSIKPSPLGSSNHSLNSQFSTPGRQSPPSSPPKGILSSSSSSSSSRDHPRDTTSTKKRMVGKEYELKNSRDALIGSISAVVSFLLTYGVPKPACEQLQKNLEMGRYFAVMKRAQDYIQCLASQDEDEIMAKIHLAVTAWEALCRFKTIEYKRAYKFCFNLRYEFKGTTSPHEIKTAIEMQVKMAEQCTACQKKLYLVQKWQRHLLNKMKRSTMIEPAGYKPIRCI